MLDWVCNRLLEATWLTLPMAVRRSWNGSLALDATFAGTWARGAGKKADETSADPEACCWGRDEDHFVPDPDKVDLKAVGSDGGVQGEHKGMVLVEGRRYSPSITKALREATIDRKVRHTIDGETYRSLIKAREPYTMRYRGPQGAEPRPAGPPRPRLKLRPQPVAGEVPEVCKTREVLALNNVHLKHQQDLPYESQEWNDVYHSLRNAVEGVNGTLKSDGVTGLEEPGNRRSTGLAATANTDGTMSRELPRKKRKPRPRPPWTRDWLPDRATAAVPAVKATAATAARSSGRTRRPRRPEAGEAQAPPAPRQPAPSRMTSSTGTTRAAQPCPHPPGPAP